MKAFVSNCARLIVVTICLQLSALAQGDSSRTAAAPSDEATLNEVIKKYFAAYAAKDLPSLTRLWSERSPDLSASIAEAQKAFAKEDYSFGNVAIHDLKLSVERAVLTALAETTIVDVETKKTWEENHAYTFALIKEVNEWKIWYVAPGSEYLSEFLEKGSKWKAPVNLVEEFADEIANAKTDAELRRLLAENKSLVTPSLGNALMRKISPLEYRGDYQQSIPLLKAAIEILTHVGDKQRVAETERRLGSAFRLAGDYRQAVERYQNAIARFDALGNRSGKAAALADIGIVYLADQKHALALEFSQKALAEYEALKDNTGITNTLEQIASAHYDQENFDAALDFFERVLKLRVAAGLKAEIAATLNSIGNVYFQREEHAAAIDHYKRAIAGFIEVNHNEAVAATTSNIAAAFYSLGNYDAAIENYRKAYRLESQIEHKRGQADALVKLAQVYSAVGNYSLAIESLRGGLDRFAALRDRSRTASAEAELGEAYQKVRNYDAALEHYEKSLALYSEMKSNADSGTVLAAIGNVYYLQSRFDLAIENYEKATTRYEAIKHSAGVAGLAGSIASAHHAQGKSDLALEFYQKSLSQFEALGDRPRIASTLESLALVHYTRGEYVKSLEVARGAATMAEEVKSLDTLWRARLIEGMNFRATLQPDKERESFEQAVKIVLAMRDLIVRGEQHRFFQGKAAPFIAAFETLIAQEKVFDAFAYAEQVKNGLLWGALQSGGARIVVTMTAREQEDERRLESEILSLKAQINRLRQRRQPDQKRLAELDARLQKAIVDYRAFEGALYAARPQLKALRAESSPIKAEELGRLLPDNSTALLEFIVTDSRAYLLAITREEPKPKERQSAQQRRTVQSQPQTLLNAYVLGTTRGELSERIVKLREMIAARDEKAPQIARELYELLLRPAEAQLMSKTSWVIIPDATLWQLPFHALQPAEGRYLVEDHAISYAPSLTAYDEIIKRAATNDQTAGPTLLAVGNPIISKQTIERIKLMSGQSPEPPAETESEIKAIKQLYGAADTLSRTGAEASEDVVKEQAGKSTVAHFAAPALVDDLSPMYSHVALSRSEKSEAEDGLFETWEMLKQSPARRLVVMSSSEAARKSITGEGLAAWSWSLFVAGCPTIVAGQWRTDQPSANEFMIEFHRSLKWNHVAANRARARQSVKSEIGVAHALRQAALKLIRRSDRRHPFYWASFRAIGDAR